MIAFVRIREARLSRDRHLRSLILKKVKGKPQMVIKSAGGPSVALGVFA